jgi:class 3 adenylate cyclase
VVVGLSVVDEVRDLRGRSKRTSATLELGRAPAELWPFFSNSDMLNHRSRYGPLATRYVSREEGTPLVLAAGAAGPLEFEFVERPHSFLAPRWLEVDRPFLRGPLRYAGYRLALEPRAGGGTRLEVELRWVDRYGWFPVGFVMADRMRRYLAEFRRIDEQLGPGGGEAPWAPFLADPAARAGPIDRLARAWGKLAKEPAIAQAMAEFVITAPDAYVRRIRPFEVAHAFGLPPLEVLAFALRAVRAGHLDMRWDILCPSCEGSAAPASHLSDLEPTVHCPGCNIEYGARFDENVEVTFFPVARVRAFNDAAFCAGSPSNIPHVMMQLVLEAGETRTIALDLPPGEYALRDELLGLGSSAPLTIREGGSEVLSVRLGERRSGEGRLVLAPGARIESKNPGASFETLRVQRLAHRERAATAAQVTALQVFRDLFGSEVLRPGLRLGVSNVTLLFSDLKGSTALYEERGDAPAFALVQDHFAIMSELIGRREGAVVKTIGDAVMAVFMRPAEAVRAALEILEAFHQWNRARAPEEQIVIKLGLHCGPALALNLNDKLDYFGSTVNRAARVQGQSEGDDVVLSEAFYEDPEVGEVLASAGPLEVSRFSVELKGIGALGLVRIRIPRGPGLV